MVILSKKYVIAFVERMDMEAQGQSELFEARLRVERHVHIPGGSIPPRKAQAIDVSRLEQG